MGAGQLRRGRPARFAGGPGAAKGRDAMTKSQRGFTLNEMILVLGLLGVAGLLGSRLFTASMRVIGSAPAAQDQQVSMERMTQVLRRDVWSAKQINVPQAKVIELVQPDGASVRWQITE